MSRSGHGGTRTDAVFFEKQASFEDRGNTSGNILSEIASIEASQDPKLIELIEAWPTLSESARLVIMKIIFNDSGGAP